MTDEHVSPDRIWLLPHDGEQRCWADEPDPSGSGEDGDATEYVRADIAEHRRAQPVRVKALEWEEYNPGCFRAYTEFGTYWVGEGQWSFDHDEDWRKGDASDAQADYERRILSALEPAPVVIADEMVMDALSAWRDHEFDEPAMRDAPRMRLALQAALTPNGGSGDE